MERTDGELMEASKAGDTAAFAELVLRHGDRVYAFVLRYSGDPSIAEDALQETFIKVWKNRKKFESGRSFRPWLLSIARNAALDLVRKRRDRSFSSLEDVDEGGFGEDVADESVDIPSSFDDKIMSKVLEETIKTLTPDQRAAVVLHDIEGMTFDEAGKVMGKPLNTVKSHYRRALIALRKKLLHQRD